MANHDSHKDPETGRLLRVEEAAVALAISPATVRRWCAAGLLEAVNLPGRGLRVPASSVAAITRERSRR